MQLKKIQNIKQYPKKLKVQRTAIFVEMISFSRFKGAAHRNIKFNVAVRCTFNFSKKTFAKEQP